MFKSEEEREEDDSLPSAYECDDDSNTDPGNVPDEQKLLDTSLSTDSATYEGSTSDESLDSTLSGVLDHDGRNNDNDILRRRGLGFGDDVLSKREDAALQDHSILPDLEGDEAKLHAPSKWKAHLAWKKKVAMTLSLVLFGLLCRSCILKRGSRKRLVHNDWGRLARKDARRLRRSIKRSNPDNSFTIQLTTSRLDLLRRSIDAHAGCPSVQNLQIHWKSEMKLPMNLLRSWSNKISQPNEKSSNAVLLLDEDVIFTCDELERAFALWRKNQDRMIGFFPFLDRKAGETPQESPGFSLEPVRRGGGQYSLVSSRAAFIHRVYIESFTADENDLCQHVALSIHSTAISSKPPLAVAAQPQELRASALSPSPRVSITSSGQPGTGSCLRYWIEGHSMKSLPMEEATYLGL